MPLVLRPRSVSAALRRFAAVCVLVAGPTGALVLGCQKDQVLVGAGQDCDLAADCQPGLVCIEERASGRRVCSSDLTNVQGELPPDGGAAAADASRDGAANPEGGPPPQDGGTVTPPQDSGSMPGPQDAAADG